jgi:hypothetical protein
VTAARVSLRSRSHSLPASQGAQPSVIAYQQAGPNLAAPTLSPNPPQHRPPLQPEVDLEVEERVQALSAQASRLQEQAARVVQEAAIIREFNRVRHNADRQSELDPNMQTDRHGNHVLNRVRHTSIYDDFPPLKRERQSDLHNQGASLRPRTLNLETPASAPAPVCGWNEGGRAEIPIDSPIIPPATGASNSSSMSGATKNDKLVEKNIEKLAQYTGRTVNGRDKMPYEDHREIFDNAIDIAPNAIDESKGIWFRINM